jgi:hypothetical protein
VPWINWETSPPKHPQKNPDAVNFTRLVFPHRTWFHVGSPGNSYWIISPAICFSSGEFLSHHPYTLTQEKDEARNHISVSRIYVMQWSGAIIDHFIYAFSKHLLSSYHVSHRCQRHTETNTNYSWCMTWNNRGADEAAEERYRKEQLSTWGC